MHCKHILMSGVEETIHNRDHCSCFTLCLYCLEQEQGKLTSTPISNIYLKMSLSICNTPSTDELFPDTVLFHIDMFHLGMHKTHHKYRCTSHHQDGITVRRTEKKTKQNKTNKTKQNKTKQNNPLFFRQMGLQSRVGRSGLFDFDFCFN